jgi:hypothetical protein
MQQKINPETGSRVRSPSRFLLLGLLVAVLVSAGGYALLRIKYPPVSGWTIPRTAHPAFKALDPWIREAFLDTSRPANRRYADLFRYLVAGFLAYRSEDGARSYYPGYASSHGRDIDGMEGFSRIAPLVGAWLAGGRPATVQVPNFGDIDLLDLLRSGIVAGTNPASDAYWGDIQPMDQRLVESADIALAVWLARDLLWPVLDTDERTRLVNWLAQASGKAENARFVNWHLFPLIVNRTLKHLGQPVSEDAYHSDWSVIATSYAGNGWFRDDRDEGLDYYNAWSFHYALYWLTEIDRTLDAAFVDEARTAFAGFYRHLVTPGGFPVLGRSICYRTAMPVPLLIDSIKETAVVAPGEARRALDLIWRYFVDKGALAEGVLTQGYCGPDLRILDTYSGPASCLWGARSLIVALSQPDEAPLWTADEVPLPVEKGDFSINDTTAGWQVKGDRDAASVVIRRTGKTANPPMKPYSLKYKLASLLLRRPFGPGNRRAKYDGAEYGSAEPFCGCLTPDR